MKALFQLRLDATISEVTGHLTLLHYKTKAVQDSLFDLTHVRKEILDNFEEIGGLIAQQESNIEEMRQLSHFLNNKTIEEVQK